MWYLIPGFLQEQGSEPECMATFNRENNHNWVDLGMAYFQTNLTCSQATKLSIKKHRPTSRCCITMHNKDPWRKNKDTPPAMTPRNFTFFPAAQSSVLQPFQGFVTFAFWHDLHFHWYLHDFVVVFMNLQWSKHSIFVPIQKKPKFLYFSLASLCQRAKFFQSCKSFNPHTISNVTTCDVATIPEISTA